MFKMPAKSLLSDTLKIDPATGKHTYVLSREDVVAYARTINPRLHPYFCAATGELSDSLWAVIRTSVQDFCRHGFVHSWCRTRSWPEMSHAAGSLFLPRCLVFLNNHYYIHKQEERYAELYHPPNNPELPQFHQAGDLRNRTVSGL